MGSTPINSSVQKVMNGSARKLLWQVKMKDDVARFRAEVVAYSVSINQILAAATIDVFDLCNVLVYLDFIRYSVKAHADRLDTRVTNLQRDNQLSFNS
jgi:hypothetical protein